MLATEIEKRIELGVESTNEFTLASLFRGRSPEPRLPPRPPPRPRPPRLSPLRLAIGAGLKSTSLTRAARPFLVLSTWTLDAAS